MDSYTTKCLTARVLKSWVWGGIIGVPRDEALGGRVLPSHHGFEGHGHEGMECLLTRGALTIRLGKGLPHLREVAHGVMAASSLPTTPRVCHAQDPPFLQPGAVEGEMRVSGVAGAMEEAWPFGQVLIDGGSIEWGRRKKSATLFPSHPSLPSEEWWYTSTIASRLRLWKLPWRRGCHNRRVPT